jgi:hypothetical protein
MAVVIIIFIIFSPGLSAGAFVSVRLLGLTTPLHNGTAATGALDGERTAETCYAVGCGACHDAAALPAAS